MALTKRNSMFLNTELLSVSFAHREKEREKERDRLSSDEIIWYMNSRFNLFKFI